MTIERILNKTQRRTVLAVHGERQRLIAELGECDAALNDLAETYRIAHELPEGEYHFQGNGDEIRIVKVEKPAQAVPVPQEGEEAKGEEKAAVGDAEDTGTEDEDNG